MVKQNILKIIETSILVAGGFPSGQYRLETRIQEIELAVLDGANEIDAVINRAAVLEGDWRLLFDEIVEMKRACLEKATLKMILSTGELGNSANIYKAAIVAMSAGLFFYNKVLIFPKFKGLILSRQAPGRRQSTQPRKVHSLCVAQ